MTSSLKLSSSVLFQSTPSARRATAEMQLAGRLLIISIHALREEGDPYSVHVLEVGRRISIHALREEGDASSSLVLVVPFLFQSTPSARRATEAGRWSRPWRRISIHALREEGDPAPSLLHAPARRISIHALREEGDWRPDLIVCDDLEFQSTPSARRATGSAPGRPCAGRDFNPRPPRGGRLAAHALGLALFEISIHALREEGDRGCAGTGRASADFNPRPPRGGRQRFQKEIQRRRGFQSTPSARRATPAYVIR